MGKEYCRNVSAKYHDRERRKTRKTAVTHVLLNPSVKLATKDKPRPNRLRGSRTATTRGNPPTFLQGLQIAKQGPKKGAELGGVRTGDRRRTTAQGSTSHIRDNEEIQPEKKGGISKGKANAPGPRLQTGETFLGKG